MNTFHTFDALLLDTARDLDMRHRHGGLIPIPSLRRELAPALGSDAAFDAALLGSERRFVVDLKTSNDRRLVAEPSMCIEDPRRGILEYLVIR